VHHSDKTAAGKTSVQWKYTNPDISSNPWSLADGKNHQSMCLNIIDPEVCSATPKGKLRYHCKPTNLKAHSYIDLKKTLRALHFFGPYVSLTPISPISALRWVL